MRSNKIIAFNSRNHEASESNRTSKNKTFTPQHWCQLLDLLSDYAMWSKGMKYQDPKSRWLPTQMPLGLPYKHKTASNIERVGYLISYLTDKDQVISGYGDSNTAVFGVKLSRDNKKLFFRSEDSFSFWMLD